MLIAGNLSLPLCVKMLQAFLAVLTDFNKHNFSLNLKVYGTNLLWFNNMKHVEG